MDKPWNDVGQVEATIEPVLELRQISLSVLGSNRMVSAAQRALDIAENRVHPSELGALYARTSPADYYSLMSTARRGDAMKAGQPIDGCPSPARSCAGPGCC